MDSCCSPADVTFVSLESAPTPDAMAVSVKKSKPASSAEEEEKEVFVLHVSEDAYCVYSFSKNFNAA